MVANQQSVNVLSKGRKPTIYKFVKWNQTICKEKLYKWTRKIVFVITG